MQPHRKLGHIDTMLIRTYQPQDEAAVIELWRVCQLTRSWNNPKKDIARKVAEQPELFMVGLLEGQLVASAMFGYDGHRGSVSYLGVLPRYQRKGYGRQLMVLGEALLKECGCPKVNLLVRTSNAAVIAFYQRLGYVTDEVVEMGKRLSAD